MIFMAHGNRKQAVVKNEWFNFFYQKPRVTDLVAFTEKKHATGDVPFLAHSIAYTGSILCERENNRK